MGDITSTHSISARGLLLTRYIISNDIVFSICRQRRGTTRGATRPVRDSEAPGRRDRSASRCRIKPALPHRRYSGECAQSVPRPRAPAAPYAQRRQKPTNLGTVRAHGRFRPKFGRRTIHGHDRQCYAGPMPPAMADRHLRAGNAVPPLSGIPQESASTRVGITPKWRPVRGSNPCYQRERLVS